MYTSLLSVIIPASKAVKRSRMNLFPPPLQHLFYYYKSSPRQTAMWKAAVCQVLHPARCINVGTYKITALTRNSLGAQYQKIMF